MSALLSPVHALLERIVDVGPRGHAVIDAFFDSLPIQEQAAIGFDWSGFWARPSQVPPSTPWRSFGTLGGRGLGKTRTNVEHVIGEVDAGRAMRVALVGQSEAKTIEILVEGETGLLALTPPWIGAEWESSSNRVVFGNGATATVYTSQEPGGLRGPQHHLAIATELASWPATSRAEAMSNLLLGLRLGYGRLLWDATPRRRNPLIKERLDLATKSPAKHVVVRGATRENALNLSPDVVAEWEEQWGGTAKGREELEGIFFDDDEDALFKSAWFEKTRRKTPETLKRRIISLDPAITDNPKRSDATGILDMGLGLDGQVYVFGNKSGVHRAETWPGMVLDLYTAGHCDLIVCELNRGGSAWAALLRSAARDRGLTFIEIGPDEVPGARAGVVFFRGHTSRGTKVARASGAAALSERGRVSFVIGADLGSLEDRLCSFDGSENKPDDEVDSFTAGVHELASLGADVADPAIGFRGLEVMTSALADKRPNIGTNAPVSEAIRAAFRTSGAGGWNGGRI